MSVLSGYREDVDGKVDLEKLLETLEKLTRECQENENRLNLDLSILVDLDWIMKHSLLWPSPSDKIISTLTQCLRFLRNSTIQCKRTQNFIREKTEILKVSTNTAKKITEEFVFHEKTDYEETLLILLRCYLQFVANFMVDNLENAISVSNTANETICYLLKSVDDDKIIQYAAMCLHILMKLYPQWIGNVDVSIFQVLLKHTNMEFVMLGIETFSTNEAFMSQKLNQLDTESRIKLMNVIISHEHIHAQVSKVSLGIVNTFKSNADLILNSKLESDELLCWEMAAILELLGCLTASEFNSPDIAADSSLLASAIYLLKSIHLTGKTDASSDFAVVRDLDSLHINEKTESMRGHPTFQFKGNLIRLIANIVHRNFEHQEMVRETEALAIILDSCQIDARNPFITQWATLAIRNICEGNLENQEYIRKIQAIDTEDAMSKFHFSFSSK